MFSKYISKLLFAVLGDVRVMRNGHRPPRGACVLVSNHISHFDPPLLSVAVDRKIDWMAMKDLFKHPAAAFYFRAVDAFPTDRENVDRASVKTALNRLKKGRMVGVFPEGGLRAGATSVLEGAPILPGAGVLAQMAAAPVFPCVILGTDRLYHRKNWRIFGKTPFWVGFGPPITPPEGMTKSEARAFLDDEIAKALKRIRDEMRAYFQLADADLPKTPQERRKEP